MTDATKAYEQVLESDDYLNLVQGDDLTGNELKLLLKLYAYQVNGYAPSMAAIDQAARTEGRPAGLNIKALYKIQNSLETKGYLQKQVVHVNGYGNVWLRAVTLRPWSFVANDRLVVGNHDQEVGRLIPNQ